MAEVGRHLFSDYYSLLTVAALLHAGFKQSWRRWGLMCNQCWTPLKMADAKKHAYQVLQSLMV